MKLTDTQEGAVTYGGRNLQLIACAGSGKTEVVAVTVLTPGRPETLLPRNIIAFTFTYKAAAELKERIVNRTRQALGEVPGMAKMFVGTIHAFCLELLKSLGPHELADLTLASLLPISSASSLPNRPFNRNIGRAKPAILQD